MEEFTLTVQERSLLGHKVRHLRSEGLVPAVVYGAGQPASTLQIEHRELERLIKQGGGAHIISLVGEGLPVTQALIREVQRHPLRRTIQHVDFVRVAAGAKVRMSVPLTIVGHSPAQAQGAIPLLNVSAVEIECLPEDLPTHIEVDISNLAHTHQRVVAADLALPPGVTLVGEHGDEALVSLALPRGVSLEEEEAAALSSTSVEPELVRKRREEEE